jgi:hypothetical protein
VNTEDLQEPATELILKVLEHVQPLGRAAVPRGYDVDDLIQMLRKWNGGAGPRSTQSIPVCNAMARQHEGIEFLQAGSNAILPPCKPTR